jgi:hypothetical protein
VKSDMAKKPAPMPMKKGEKMPMPMKKGKKGC